MFTVQLAPRMVIKALKADAVKSLENVDMMCVLEGVSIHKLIIPTVNPNGESLNLSPMLASMLLPSPKCFEWLLDDIAAKAEKSKADRDAFGDAWEMVLASMEDLAVSSMELRMSSMIHRRYLQLLATRSDLAAMAKELNFSQTFGPRATEVLVTLLAEIDANKQKAELESAMPIPSMSAIQSVKSIKTSLRV